jgi:hypothetical protein
MIKQLARQDHFGFLARTNGRGDGIANPQLQQHGHAHFGKGGSPTPALGLGHKPGDLRSVGHRKAAAVGPTQAQAVIERFGMFLELGSGTERLFQDHLEELPVPTATSLGECALADGMAGECLQMFGEGARPGQDMKDQTHQ